MVTGDDTLLRQRSFWRRVQCIFHRRSCRRFERQDEQLRAGGKPTQAAGAAASKLEPNAERKYIRSSTRARTCSIGYGIGSNTVMETGGDTLFDKIFWRRLQCILHR